MSIIGTTVRLVASASFTGSVFVLPLSLLLAGDWQYAPTSVDTLTEPVTAEWALFTPAAPEARMDAEVALDSTPGDETETEAPQAGGADVGDELVAPMGRRIDSTNARSVRRSAPIAARTAPAEEGTDRGRKGQRCEVDEVNPAINKAGRATFDVQRDLLSWYAKHPGKLDNLGWVARHEGADGKPDGFRLGGVSCGSDLHQAGLRAGDVVHSVNGKSINNVAQALFAYTSLKKSDELEVVITRKGERKVLTYRLG